MVPELERFLLLCLRYRAVDESTSLLICVYGLILIITLLKESFTLLAHLNLSTCANQCLSTA